MTYFQSNRHSFRRSTVKYFFAAVLVIFAMFVGCTSDVAKDTTKDTAKDVTKEVEKGINDLSQNIADAAPYIQEDISEGFWSALDTVGEAMGVGTSEPLPKPGDPEHLKLHAQVDAAVAQSVVETEKRTREQNISELGAALAILSQVINEEIVKAESQEPAVVTETGAATTPATQEASGDIVKPRVMPTPEQVQAAWEALAKTVDRPSAARNLFNNILRFVNTHPEYKSKAGIAGPVTADKIGEKARTFLAALKVGDVSKPFKFMDGWLIIQVIDDNPEKIEVGYIYMPETLAQTTTPADASGTTPPGTVTGDSSAPSSGG